MAEIKMPGWLSEAREERCGSARAMNIPAESSGVSKTSIWQLRRACGGHRTSERYRITDNIAVRTIFNSAHRTVRRAIFSEKIKGEGFIERTLENIASFMLEAFDGGQSGKSGLLQSIEPRARIIGVFLLVFAAALAGNALMLSAIIFFAVTLALLSGVGMMMLLKRILPALFFASVIVMPVSLSFVTPGRAVFGAWGVAVTREGLADSAFIIARVTAMAALMALLLLTTGRSGLLSGLRGIAPAVFVTALFMTFRYIQILLRTYEDSALARKSRTISGTSLRDAQGWFAARAGFILKKTVATADEVALAMVSRGFTGRLNSFEGRSLRRKDSLFIGLASFVLFLSAGF